MYAQTSEFLDPQGANLSQEVYELLVAKNGTTQDVLTELQKKAELDNDAIAATRLYATQGNKISKELTADYPVASITDYAPTVAQRTPKEDLVSREDEKPVYVFHFEKEVSKTHGMPFKFHLQSVRPRLWWFP